MRRFMLRQRGERATSVGPDVLVRRAILDAKSLVATKDTTLYRVDVLLHFAPTVPDYTLSVTLPVESTSSSHVYYRTLMADGSLGHWRPVTGSVIEMQPHYMTKLLDPKAAGFSLLLAVPKQQTLPMLRVLVEFAASGWRSVTPMQPAALHDLSLPGTTADQTITVVWNTAPPSVSSAPSSSSSFKISASALLIWSLLMFLVVCVIKIIAACRQRRMRQHQHREHRHVEVQHQPQHHTFTIPPPVYHAPPPYTPQAPPPVAPQFQQQQQQLPVY